MRAIIIAAGRGRRLEHHTEERPKCMVTVGGRSILDIQLHAFRENGVDDLHVVRGYLADKLIVPGATYYLNEEFETNNILLSLFYAEAAMEGAFLTTYSDIVFTPRVVRAVVDSPADIALVVDRQWHTAYEERKDHPVAQAELTVVDGDRVVQVGKQVGEQGALGEFIGLAKFSERGGRMLREVYNEVRASHVDDAPFHAATRFRNAYLTDLFMELIARGAHVGFVSIDGGWREIDTVEDLARVDREWSAIETA